MSLLFPVGVGTGLHVLSFVPIISHSHLMGSLLFIWYDDEEHRPSLAQTLSLSLHLTHTHTHTYKGVSLFEPVAGHLSGRGVGSRAAASIVRGNNELTET